MNISHAFAATLALLAAPAVGTAAQAPEAAAAATAPAGVQQVAIGPLEQRMILAIWHPPGMQAGADGSAMGRFPLVVMSHGTGAGPMAHVDTAEALAAAGFVVVAPMHRGDNFQDDSKVGRTDWMASRSRDVSAAIDYMLEEWPGREQVDARRVGIFGFSAGATAALVAAGGILDPGRIAAHCAAQREFVCEIMAPPAPARAAAVDWPRDPRIAAAVLAAPGLGFGFEPSGLEQVAVPVQLWAGGADRIVPTATNAAVVKRLLRGPVDFRSVDNAVHLSFLTPCGPDGPPQLCQDNEGFDRSAFHREFNAAVVAFFRTHL